MKRQFLNIKGSILIEGCVTLILVLFILIVQIESIRRIWVGAAAQSAAFASVRGTVLGEASYQNEMRASKLIASALPRVRGNNESKRTFIEHREIRADQRMLSKYHIKYPALMRFREVGFSKLNFEVTEQCYFPFLLRH